MNIREIKVKDFSPTPFGRYPTDGKFNGQRFRKEILKPAFTEIGENIKIKVDFNGIVPVGSAFLDEAFGGLVRDESISAATVLARLEIISDLPFYDIQVKQFIEEAQAVDVPLRSCRVGRQN